MSYQAHTSSDQTAHDRPASPSGSLRGAARERSVAALRRLASKQVNGAPFRLVPPDGNAIDFGRGGEPVFTLRVVGPQGGAGAPPVAPWGAPTPESSTRQ